MSAIEVRSLNKNFTRNLTRKVRALDNVSFVVPEGSVFGFIGPNGAGKSTTIKIMMGLLFPTSGETFFYGERTLEPQSRKRVGYLAENPAFYDYLTPRELLGCVGRSYGMGGENLQRKIDEVLELVELKAAADRPIRNLSKGMVQRIGLGQALVHDPDLYILDEPMSGLDPLGRRLVADIILDLKSKGKTVFFSTHIIHDVERICDDVAILLEGRLKFCGSVRDVVDESFMRYEVLLKGSLDGKLAFPEQGGVQVVTENDHCRVLIPRASIHAVLPPLLQHAEMLSIEPERRTLEQLFLELIKTGKHAH